MTPGCTESTTKRAAMEQILQKVPKKLRVSGEPGRRVSKFMKCRARNKLGDKKYTDVIFITPPFIFNKKAPEIYPGHFIFNQQKLFCVNNHVVSCFNYFWII